MGTMLLIITFIWISEILSRTDLQIQMCNLKIWGFFIFQICIERKKSFWKDSPLNLILSDKNHKQIEFPSSICSKEFLCMSLTIALSKGEGYLYVLQKVEIYMIFFFSMHLLFDEIPSSIYSWSIQPLSVLHSNKKQFHSSWILRLNLVLD